MVSWMLFLVAQGAFLAKKSEVHVKTGSGIDQVIGVLKEMLTAFNDQSVEDKHNWEEYSKWSGDEETDRNSFIQEQEGLVMSATAQLNANKQQVQTLTEQITDLASEIAETETSIAELVHLRQGEHKGHEEEIADLTHTIEAVNKATEVLEGHYAASASMAEIKAEVTKALSALALNRASDPKMAVVTGFLQNPDWLATDGGAAYGSYEGVAAQSGGVVGTLKSIRSTLTDNKQASIEKENESRRQYESAKAAKESDLRRSNEEKAAKENTLEECNAKIEHFTATISQATADIADAKTYIEHLLKDRALFSKEYDQRVATRNQEQAATQAALDALQEVTAGAKGGVEGAFLQIGSGLRAKGISCPKCSATVQHLLKVGQTTHNAALVQLGTSIESHLSGTEKQPQGFFDPQAMAPITNLLRELINKLEDELNAETSHHEWCETEKATSAAAKLEREHNIETLTAEIDELSTRIAQLTSEIAFLASELIRIQQETEAAVHLRKEEKASYEKAKGDHDHVIEALDKAMSALSGQYALFVQVDVHNHVKTPFSDYSSGASGGASAMEMLQDLLNRYSAARTQLIQAEEAAVAAHEDLLARNEQFRKDTTQTKQAKETEKRQAMERLTNARAELAANQNELTEVNTYIADLRPSCDDIRSTFEERKKRREAEIAALKETLAVLDDPSMMR